MMLDVKRCCMEMLHGDLGNRAWAGCTAVVKALSENMLSEFEGPKRGLCSRRQANWGQQVEMK